MRGGGRVVCTAPDEGSDGRDLRKRDLGGCGTNPAVLSPAVFARISVNTLRELQRIGLSLLLEHAVSILRGARAPPGAPVRALARHVEHGPPVAKSVPRSCGPGALPNVRPK